jgi:uncharacterized protein (TIGR02391 family)
MARRLNALDGVPPSLTVHQAVELLRKRIAEADAISALHRHNPEVEKWVTTTVAVLDCAFGKPNGGHSEMADKFRYISGASYYGKSDQFYEMEHRKNMARRKAVLESCIEQLEMLAPPAAQVAEGRYQFHAEIERVSGDLFRDGHYSSAALQAYIRVIDEVKQRSGLNLDGDKLMNQAFGCENKVPVLKFNTLSTEAERDEQQGFLYLFKGIVGLRNSKAHSNRLFNDPSRGHEYLALASLLMRILELAS